MKPKTVRKSVLVWHGAPEMFALVADVERYPEFLPWCEHGRVLERTPNGMVASIGMAFGGVHKSFTTRNVHEEGRRIRIALVDGPFSQLEGDWTFTPLGEGAQRACRIDFVMTYGFASSVLAALVGPVFDRIADTLVDAFVKRADQVYGAG
ncbi:Persistence and stress-resistance toxin PasT [Tepidimonas alkaliphilus]|uniref:Persistence and stress-resistance toxin PasT n=1 Tax=Tepidimonas alkaliphilus TaxID=2588942 RepID=A0A554WAH5_9BURK|nr:type II toxin-antitoxin system RatA family toxin [Tepidimonas alkaliphilus]TSE20583.1 Persistence and stress-resistance toxin PasT [Tepidimonas alkaliphilus]